MSRDGIRVLAVHRYYWPDTPPYASILRSIASRWSSDGHDVEVLSTQPSYKPGAKIERQPRVERLDGVLVRRIKLPTERGRPMVRLLNAALFTVAVLHRVLVGQYDVVMVSTSPPVVLGWAASLAARARGARFVYHCMDIHPEIGRMSGDFGNPIVFKALRRLDRGTCARASSVVVLSEDMAEALAARQPRRRLQLEVINNFELCDEYKDAAEAVSRPTRDRKIRVVFTGNVGRFQGLNTFIEALAHVEHASRVELVVMGSGSAAAGLRAQAAQLPGGSVVFLPHQDVGAARALIRSADLCLVSLASGIHRYAYPSKTMTYVAEGRPLLVVMESRSELVQTVESLGIGVSSPPNDSLALASVLNALIAEPEQLVRLREAAETKGPALFDRDHTLERWSALMRRQGEEARPS